MKVSITGFKKWRTDDGGGCQGFLTVDGVKALWFHDDGNGGEMEVTDGPPTLVRRGAVREGSPAMQDAYNAFVAYAKARPVHIDGCGDHEWTNDDRILFAIFAAVDDYENDKRFARLCKTSTLFRTADTEEGAWRQIKSPFTPAVKAFLVKTHGADVVILNEQLEKS